MGFKLYFVYKYRNWFFMAKACPMIINNTITGINNQEFLKYIDNSLPPKAKYEKRLLKELEDYLQTIPIIIQRNKEMRTYTQNAIAAMTTSSSSTSDTKLSSLVFAMEITFQ